MPGISRAASRPRWRRSRAIGRAGARRRTTGIVVYSSQHAALTQAWADAFTAETGIPVTHPQGHRHGDGQPDRPGGRQLAGRRVPDRELAGDGAGRERRAVRAGRSPRRSTQVPEEFRPASGIWTGIAARTTVFAYNTELLAEAELPASMLDLAEPEWQGRWGAAPAGADFQAIVSALLQLARPGGDRRLADRAEAERACLSRQLRGDARRQRRRGRGRADLPVLLLRRPATAPARARTRSRCTTSATRIRAPSSRSPAAACWRRAAIPTQAQAFLAFVTGPRGPGDPARRQLVRVPGRQRRRGESRDARRWPSSTIPGSIPRC